MENKEKSMPLNAFLKSISEHAEVSLSTFITSLILLFLAILTFVKNYKYNDNHLNWLNHDYSKNLLMCSEQDSVFMTEGGDNQVFGSLYFTYAEKIRPDISPYDQKGNIFKRIYGDMRYIDPQTLQRRMQVVDTHLFAGEEPFYEDIRDRKDPYFIPYWQGRRPVYLTWERPEPWKLDGTYFQDNKRALPLEYQKQLGLGEYYYKRYGIMYKVQNIKYKLVDYLELKKKVSLEDVRKLFSDWLHREINPGFAMEKLNSLQNEGLLKVENGYVKFVKMYPEPNKDGYFENLLLRWKDIPNAKYFDVLSREIIINYGYQFGEIYREKVNELTELKKNEKDPAVLKEIDNRIKENWQKAKEYYEIAIYYGWDSLSVLHNVSVVFLRNEIEDLSSRARELLKKALEFYPNSYGTYSVYFGYLIQDSFKNPANEEKNLKEFEIYLNQLKKVLQRYRSSGGVYSKHPVWKNFEGLERIYQNVKEFPTQRLLAATAQLENMLEKNPVMDNNNTMMAQTVITLLYIRGINFGYDEYVKKADKLTDRIIKLKLNDQAFLEWAFGLYLQTQKFEKAYEVGKIIIERKSGFSNIGNYYNFGILGFNLGKTNEAKAALKKFIELSEQDRKNLIQYRQLIDNANKILSMLK
ncbi:MAG: tetratricopeptide repeat protein [Brevinematia bacterium]